MYTLSGRLMQGRNVALAVLVAMTLLSGCGTTKDLSLRTGEVWTTEAAVARAGPKPTDHEAQIRSWLMTSLHVGTEAQFDIGEATLSMYIEEERDFFGTRKKVWYGWGSTVTVRGTARQQGTAPTSSMTCTVYMKQDRVVFAVFPNGPAIKADGTRVSPGARIPGLMQ